MDIGCAPENLNARRALRLRYVDNRGCKTETFPPNPNGSPEGITGLTTPDGRFTVMMPYPERVFRAVQHSWRPDDRKGDGPWLRLIRNARRWVGWIPRAGPYCQAVSRRDRSSDRSSRRNGAGYR